MVAFLLLLVVLILLFGAASVRGWISAIIFKGLIGIALVAALAVAFALAGRDNMPLLITGGCTALLGLYAWAKWIESTEPERQRRRANRLEDEYRRDADATERAKAASEQQRRQRELEEHEAQFANAKVPTKEERKLLRARYKAAQD